MVSRIKLNKTRIFVILVCLCAWAISAVFFISWLVSEISEGAEKSSLEKRIDDHELRIRKLEYHHMRERR